MVCGCLRSPVMAPTGHTRAHAVQPVQLSGLMKYCINSLHEPARHFSRLRALRTHPKSCPMMIIRG